VLAAGYDGVYLDIVDAYEYWQPGGPGSPDRATAEREIVDFVEGIGKENRFYNGNKRQAQSESSWSASRRDKFKAAGKPVLVTDYVTKTRQIGTFSARANARGYIPYASQRDLDVLKVNRGHEPN
jgi:cysteinyl-tRNA synthetase, unknown class